MSKRVLPTERIRVEIDELFGSDRDLTEVLEEVVRLSLRLVTQSTLEAEVDAFFGAAPLPAAPRSNRLEATPQRTTRHHPNTMSPDRTKPAPPEAVTDAGADLKHFQSPLT